MASGAGLGTIGSAVDPDCVDARGGGRCVTDVAVLRNQPSLFGDWDCPALVDICRGPAAHGKDVTMPTKYPEEFKREVVAVARTSGLSQGQVNILHGRPQLQLSDRG